MKRKIGNNSTGVIEDVFIQDTTSTSGSGLTGLVYNSSGLTCYYCRKGGTATAVSLVAGTQGTWITRGFVAKDATNLPGVYELSLPDAAVASGAKSVLVMLKGATNMAPVILEIELDAVDYQDATRFGLGALPNAAAGANGGLPLGDASGRTNVGKWLGQPVTLDPNNLPNVNANAVGRDLTAADNLGSMAYDYNAGHLFDSLASTLNEIDTMTGGIASSIPDLLNAVSNIPTAAQIHDAIISNAFKLAPDVNGRLGVNNFPVEFLSSAEQTELTTIIGDLVALLGRTDVSTNVASITTNMATMLSRIPAVLSFTGPNVNANAQVVADKSAYSGTATNLPSDYARNNVSPSWWTAPDNADIVAALADLVILIARADETTPIGAIKAVTDKYINLLNAGGTAFLASALINAPTGSGGAGTTVVDLALTITRNGSNQPVLSWTADPSATAYKIMRSTNGTNYTQIAGVHAPTVTYTDTARPNAVNVFYSIVSVH